MSMLFCDAVKKRKILDSIGVDLKGQDGAVDIAVGGSYTQHQGLKHRGIDQKQTGGLRDRKTPFE